MVRHTLSWLSSHGRIAWTHRMDASHGRIACAILEMDTEKEPHECCDHDHSHHHHSHGPHEEQPKTQAASNFQEMLHSKIAELENGSSKDEEEERKLGMYPLEGVAWEKLI